MRLAQQRYERQFLVCFPNGAPEGNNLEPFDAPELLQELENWTEVLKGEPEVIHRLATFAEAVREDVCDADESVARLPAPEFEP